MIAAMPKYSTIPLDPLCSQTDPAARHPNRRAVATETRGVFHCEASFMPNLTICRVNVKRLNHNTQTDGPVNNRGKTAGAGYRLVSLHGNVIDGKWASFPVVKWARK